MALVTTSAVVLQTYRYSETSKVVRLATRELGVQSAIAKGALRPKSRFGAGLDALAGASPDAIDAAGVRGIWLLLGVLGFEPSLGTCVRDGTAIDPDGTDPVSFSVAEGGVACPSCAPAPPLARLPRQAY